MPYDYESKHKDELYEHYLSKNTSDFWKCWSSSFHRKVNKEICIDGSNKDLDIANSFAAHFSKVFCSSDCSGGSTSEFHNLHANLKAASNSKPDFDALITVEAVDKCVNQLKLGKACGPDELSSEHIKYAQPALILQITH